MSPDLTNAWSTLVPVMVWCRQATSHFLGQCCPRSISPHGVTVLQWVNFKILFQQDMYSSLPKKIRPLPHLGRGTPYCLMDLVNPLRPRRNRRYFADDIFKCIFSIKNVLISIKVSLKFIPNGPINNIPALVQIMAWCPPLSESMMIILLPHICVTRLQWVKHWFWLWFVVIVWTNATVKSLI